MATIGRYSGVVFSGSAVGRNAFYDALLVVVQAHGWTLLETVGTRDVVIYSSGADNDARIFIRLTAVSTTSINATSFQDWSTNDHAGTNAGGAVSISLSAAGTIAYSGRINEYECTFLTTISAVSRLTSFGTPLRINSNGVSAATSGVGIVTDDAAQIGGDVEVSIDRDLSLTIQPGQLVMVYSLTPVGDALVDGTIQVLTVTDVAAGTITLPLSADITAGAIIGFDPSPGYAMSLATGGNLSCEFGYKLDGTAVATTGAGSPLRTAYTEASNDPHPSGLAVGLRALISTALGVRGHQQHIVWSPILSPTPQADGDFMRANYDDTQKYKVFPSLAITGGVCAAIGPGW